VFQNQGEAWQAAPTPDSEFYDEEMAKQYTQYDVALAEQHLDRAGLTRKDSDGFRLGPDGKRITITVEVALPALVPFWVDAMNLVAEYWKNVGIATHVKTEDRTLYDERTRANEHDAGVWNGTGGYGDEVLGPLYYFPVQTALVAWGTPWGQWFASRGEDAAAERPPEAPRRQMEMYWQMLETPGEDDRKQVFREILQIAKEQFYTIGTIRIPEGYGTVSRRMHNVPAVIPDSYRYATPAPTNPAQYFLSS
jgi:peptide/nickel transport system substrate-binding protein